MKPTNNKSKQFRDLLAAYTGDRGRAEILSDLLLDLIDERLDAKLAKPEIPEPGRPTTDSQEREFEEEVKKLLTDKCGEEISFGQLVSGPYSGEVFFVTLLGREFVGITDLNSGILSEDELKESEIIGNVWDDEELIPRGIKNMMGFMAAPKKPEPTEPERWKPEVGEEFWVALDKVIGSGRTFWYADTEDLEWYNNDRIRKTEEEALERSREINAQREATETERPDSGEDGNIKPAGPLREMPIGGEYFYGVGFSKGYNPVIKRFKWVKDMSGVALFQAGLCFPDSPEGRLGAERRAAKGIQAPIDREELREVYDRWLIGFPNNEMADDGFSNYLHSILEGGSHE